MFNSIKNGLSALGQDAAFGYNVIKDRPAVEQQYRQLVQPQVDALRSKKQTLAAKMPKPQKPSYMDSLKSGIAKGITSTGRDYQYLQ